VLSVPLVRRAGIAQPLDQRAGVVLHLRDPRHAAARPALHHLFRPSAVRAALRDSALWPLFRSPWFCAWLAFTLNTTAYTTEMFAGAIRATPSGEIEAARAMGLSEAQVLRDVFLPGAWRRALPQYGNEIVQMMHATSLASTVTIVEILRVARDVYTNYLVVPESFGMAAVFYLILTVALTQGFRLLERHYLRHLDPQGQRDGRCSRERFTSPMLETTITFPGFGPGTTHALTRLTFGVPSARPHVHVQGGLHADEGPGMLAARMLADRLAVGGVSKGGSRAALPCCRRPIPIGLGQFVLGDHAGRFDLYDGRNFNRDYPDLAGAVAARVTGTAGLRRSRRMFGRFVRRWPRRSSTLTGQTPGGCAAACASQDDRGGGCGGRPPLRRRGRGASLHSPRRARPDAAIGCAHRLPGGAGCGGVRREPVRRGAEQVLERRRPRAAGAPGPACLRELHAGTARAVGRVAGAGGAGCGRRSYDYLVHLGAVAGARNAAAASLRSGASRGVRGAGGAGGRAPLLSGRSRRKCRRGPRSWPRSPTCTRAP
jgi:hypothetical protein